MGSLRILLVAIPYILTVVFTLVLVNARHTISDLKDENKQLREVIVAKDKAYKSQVELCEDRTKIVEEVEKDFDTDKTTLHILASDKQSLTTKIKAKICSYCWKGDTSDKTNSNSSCYFNGIGWVLGKRTSD